jgi:hypothetical protein
MCFPLLERRVHKISSIERKACKKPAERMDRKLFFKTRKPANFFPSKINTFPPSTHRRLLGCLSNRRKTWFGRVWVEIKVKSYTFYYLIVSSRKLSRARRMSGRLELFPPKSFGHKLLYVCRVGAICFLRVGR